MKIRDTRCHQVKNLYFLFLSSDRFPPFRVDVKSLFQEELAGRGHRIDWLLQSSEPVKRSYVTPWGGGEAWVGKRRQGRGAWAATVNQWYGFANDLRLFRLVWKNEYDFVQVKDKFVAALLAILVTRGKKRKFVYWLSFPFPESYLYRSKRGKEYSNFPLVDRLRGHLFGFLLYRVILPAADHVFVQSKQMKKDVAAKGIPDEKLTAVPMGVALSKIPFPSGDGRSGERGARVVYIGSLGPPRRIEFLVELFKEVVARRPDARLYLVGGETEADIVRLEGLATKLGLQEHVTITGFLPLEEAWEYVRQADLCVSPLAPNPTYAPASPTKLVEYLAFGKPVVANDHPEQREVLERSGAGLCVPYEKRAFADAILELLQDPGRAADMGQRGRRYVEKHRSYQVIADSVESKYYELLGRSSPDPQRQ